MAIGLLAVGPAVMTALLGNKGFHYARLGLAVVAVGMGLHLVSGTLNQAALARGRAHLSALAWLVSAGAFVAFVAAHTISAQVTRVEVGYCGATALLCVLLLAIYRLGPAAREAAPAAREPAGAARAA